MGGGYSTNAWRLTGTVSDKSATEKLAVTSNTNVSMEGDNSYSGGTTIQGYTLTTKHENALGSGKVSLEGGILKLAAALSVSAMDYMSASSAIQTAGHNLTVDGTLNVASNVGMSITGSGTTIVNTLKLDAGASISTEGALQMNNLQMGDGSSMAAGETIALNGSLTLGSNIKLTGDLLTSSALSALQSTSDKVTLFTGITSLSMKGTTYDPSARVAYTPVDITSIFDIENVEEGRYNLYYEGGELFAGLTAAVPEPATATLSLLALAGLCARRRRKA